MALKRQNTMEAQKSDEYFKKLFQLPRDQKKYRGNLTSMLDAGFKDFDKNLNLLIAKNNNLQEACTALLD